MVLDAHALAVLALTGFAFALFASDKVSIETISLLVLVLLAVGFQIFPYSRDGEVVPPGMFFFGFGHQALIAICSLMVLGHGLVVTGALEPVSRQLARMLDAHPNTAMLVVLLLCAMGSGIMNDTPIVVLMMPILVSAALRMKQPSSRTLLPMNYAVLIGGMGTTIGTSTNLIVFSIAADMGVRPFGMFDFTHVTVLAAIPGILYLWLVLPRLIPARNEPFGDVEKHVFTAVLHIPEGSYADGKEYADAKDKLGNEVEVRRILRGNDAVELSLRPKLVLRAGDHMFIAADAKTLQEAAQSFGTTLYMPDKPEQQVDQEHHLTVADERLAEVVVTKESLLNGRTLRETRFHEFYDVTIVGVHRSGSQPTRGYKDIPAVRLRVGDILLVQGGSEGMRSLQTRAGLLVLDQSYEMPRSTKAPIMLAILAVVVALAAFKFAPISIAALAGVAAMILMRCITWEEATSALSMKVILLVASSLALAAALENTGGTAWLADKFISMTLGMPKQWILALLMLLTAGFTNFVSNNAAAAIGTPIAVNIAQELGVSPEPLVLAIMFGANFCYVTPFAYQTNLLVMSAGGYKFSDFVRGGLPLLVIMLVSFTFLLLKFFPL